MSEQQNSRISIMNFGEQLLGQNGKQFQMNNTWVPITPEKLVQIRSNTVPDWTANEMRRANYQEFPVPGCDYTNEMRLHYNGPYQNLHLLRQTGQSGENNNFGGNSVHRSSVIDHIAGSYARTQHYESNGLNSNTLELLLKKNATNIATANRNLDTSINVAARNPLLPRFYPQASSDMSYSYAASDMVYKEANRLLIPNRNSEFSGSNTDNLLNNDIHCSVSNQLKDIFSGVYYGDSHPEHYLNYVPIGEADATTSFTNSLQSIPKTTDQLKFLENQICPMPDYTIAESTSHEKDIVSCTENEIQEYCDGLLQQIVDSSSAIVSPTHGDQKGSVSNISDRASDEIFDLNKTPEQKVPRRRKHRPKVIAVAKPKRNTNPLLCRR